MKIEYVNAAGAAIVLNSGAYLVSGHDLRDFRWDWSASNRPSGYGGRVSFTRPVQEKFINIGIRGRDKFAENAAALMTITEPDIINNTPGRLYLGAQYLSCFLGVGSIVNRYAEKSGWVSKELSIVVTEPFWRTERMYRYLSGTAEPVEDGKKYDLKYNYRYAAILASGDIENKHYAASPMILTVYGPADNPTVTIGNHIYRVNASIMAGQRIEIDQIQRRIESVAESGDRTNLFDYRDKDNDIFVPLSPGSHGVLYDGSFDFDVVLVQQRSEPTWTLSTPIMS